MMSKLETLPEYLVSEIIRHLSLHDFIQMVSTNKYFKNMLLTKKMIRQYCYYNNILSLIPIDETSPSIILQGIQSNINAEKFEVEIEALKVEDLVPLFTLDLNDNPSAKQSEIAKKIDNLLKKEEKYEQFLQAAGNKKNFIAIAKLAFRKLKLISIDEIERYKELFKNTESSLNEIKKSFGVITDLFWAMFCYKYAYLLLTTVKSIPRLINNLAPQLLNSELKKRLGISDFSENSAWIYKDEAELALIEASNIVAGLSDEKIKSIGYNNSQAFIKAFIGLEKITLSDVKQELKVSIADLERTYDIKYSTIGLSIEKITALFKAKKITAVENVLRRLEFIKKINPEINAIVQYNEADALEQARLLDKKQASGEELGPLHGVIFTVKDVFKAKGYRTTAGSLGLKDALLDAEDATIIQRVKKAGAILIGKTNTPEFENSADTINSVFGATKNPYNLDRSAGGSSGGCGAAVASCMSDFSIGADHGGSLRIPAHYNGVTTIRCTPGRIPSTGYFSGVREGIGASVNTEGPIARYVDDLVLIVNIIQGPDGIDKSVIKKPPLQIKDQTEELSIAFFYDDGNSTVTQDVRNAVHIAALAITSDNLVEKAKPNQIGKGFEIYKKVFWPLAEQNFNEAFKKYHVTEPSPLITKLMENFKYFELKGDTKEATQEELNERLRERENFKSEVNEFFYEYDVLICPVTGSEALPLTNPMWDGKIHLLSFCWDTSAADLIGVVVRAGNSKDGLPIGVQIVTTPGNENIALLIAKKIEQKLGGWKKPEIVTSYCQAFESNDNQSEISNIYRIK